MAFKSTALSQILIDFMESEILEIKSMAVEFLMSLVSGTPLKANPIASKSCVFKSPTSCLLRIKSHAFVGVLSLTFLANKTGDSAALKLLSLKK